MCTILHLLLLLHVQSSITSASYIHTGILQSEGCTYIPRGYNPLKMVQNMVQSVQQPTVRPVYLAVYNMIWKYLFSNPLRSLPPPSFLPPSLSIPSISPSLFLTPPRQGIFTPHPPHGLAASRLPRYSWRRWCHGPRAHSAAATMV